MLLCVNPDRPFINQKISKELQWTRHQSRIWKILLWRNYIDKNLKSHFQIKNEYRYWIDLKIMLRGKMVHRKFHDAPQIKTLANRFPHILLLLTFESQFGVNLRYISDPLVKITSCEKEMLKWVILICHLTPHRVKSLLRQNLTISYVKLNYAKSDRLDEILLWKLRWYPWRNWSAVNKPLWESFRKYIQQT